MYKNWILERLDTTPLPFSPLNNEPLPTLTGSQALAVTHNQLVARQFDVCLDSFSVSECSGNRGLRFESPTILTAVHKDNNLSLQLLVRNNCGFYFLEIWEQ